MSTMKRNASMSSRRPPLCDLLVTAVKDYRSQLEGGPYEVYGLPVPGLGIYGRGRMVT
jgi:hypothetical protein